MASQATHHVPTPDFTTGRPHQPADPTSFAPFTICLAMADDAEPRFRVREGVRHESSVLMTAYIGATWVDVYAPREGVWA